MNSSTEYQGRITRSRASLVKNPIATNKKVTRRGRTIEKIEEETVKPAMRKRTAAVALSKVKTIREKTQALPPISTEPQTLVRRFIQVSPNIIAGLGSLHMLSQIKALAQYHIASPTFAALTAQKDVTFLLLEAGLCYAVYKFSENRVK